MCQSDNKSCGFCCPLTGFPLCPSKRFIKCFIVMLVWVNVFSWLWHSVVMGEMYQATASLWRGPDAMIGWSLYLGLALLAFFSAAIFLKGYEDAGCREGLRFGIIITLFFSGIGFITYATQPIPGHIILYWALGDLIMYSIGGMLMGAIACGKGCCSKDAASCA
ncbi:MAG: hypothetical protein KDD55_02960 [Bdellovibrionales bacterium]|nr:hypothetical protein [Bdellovibrionales bacterium]